MSIKESTKSEMSKVKVQLVQGEFLPNHALEIITSLIDQKISFHNREAAQQWEKNHDFDQSSIKKRISELENEKNNAAAFVSRAKLDGKKITVDGQLNLTAI